MLSLIHICLNNRHDPCIVPRAVPEELVLKNITFTVNEGDFVGVVGCNRAEMCIRDRPYLLDLQTKLRRLSDVGLGYLSLERQAGTLSGCLLYTSRCV